MFSVKEHRQENPLNNVRNELPEGHYRAIVEEVFNKKSSTGYDMITVKVRIIDSISGRFINGLHWENFMINHDNDDTRRIHRDRLTNLLEAHSIEEFTDLADLAKQIGTKKVSLSITRTERGNQRFTYRKEAFYFDRKNGITGLQVAARVAAGTTAAVAATASAAEQAQEYVPSPEEMANLMEPPADIDEELPF